MSASLLVYCVGVATRPGLCPIAKETALAVPMLCTEYGPNGWMDGPPVARGPCNEEQGLRASFWSFFFSYVNYFSSVQVNPLYNFANMVPLCVIQPEVGWVVILMHS